jgi:hypothetical protein
MASFDTSIAASTGALKKFVDIQQLPDARRFRIDHVVGQHDRKRSCLEKSPAKAGTVSHSSGRGRLPASGLDRY